MRLIDGDYVRDEILYGDAYVSDELAVYIKRVFDDAPTIDPESLRPQGEWVLGHVEPGHLTPGGNRPWICSECGQVKSWLMDRPTANYCPNCGARMGGGD